MIIKLYKNHSEPEKIGKDLRSEISYNGTLREQTSVLNPSVMLAATNLSDMNYMYISEFGRYYFITGIESVRNGLWRINGAVDVLESYKAAIKANHVIVADSKTHNSNYLAGGQYRSLVKTKTNIIKFSNGFLSSGTYILITAGG